MFVRKFLVRHDNSTFDVDYDTNDGLEVFRFQLFSLTLIPPDEQKIVGGDVDKVVNDDSDLISISDELRLMSIDDQVIPITGESDGDHVVPISGGVESSSVGDSHANEELLKADEEFARMLQAEEEALLLQQYVAEENNGQIEQRLEPYISQVLMYENPSYQEAARKTVPVVELEEKALVALAKKQAEVSSSPTQLSPSYLQWQPGREL